jgi:hypothetical protein
VGHFGKYAARNNGTVFVPLFVKCLKLQEI